MTVIYTGNTIELRELQEVTGFSTLPPDADIKRVMVIDTETTGLSPEVNELVEVAFSVIEFTPEGQFGKILFKYRGFQEPLNEFTPVAAQVTGLSKEKLKGEEINWELVRDILKTVDVVTSYRAEFDRPFLEKYEPEFKNKFWACSQVEIPWLDLYGFSGSQELLLQKICQVYYEAHGAVKDVEALTLLLSTPYKSGKTLFYVLLKMATAESTRIFANGAPFNKKDELRNRGYSWNADVKAWYKDIKSNQRPDEIKYLEVIAPRYSEVPLNGFNKFRPL